MCGTYIKTLTSNKAFIEELVANKAFIENLAAKVVTLQSGGIIKSSDYNGTVDGTNHISMDGTKGFAMDYDGHADFVGMRADGGTFTNIKATGGTFTQVTVSGTLILDVKTSIPSNLVNGEMFLYIGE